MWAERPMIAPRSARRSRRESAHLRLARAITSLPGKALRQRTGETQDLTALPPTPQRKGDHESTCQNKQGSRTLVGVVGGGGWRPTRTTTGRRNSSVQRAWRVTVGLGMRLNWASGAAWARPSPRARSAGRPAIRWQCAPVCTPRAERARNGGNKPGCANGPICHAVTAVRCHVPRTPCACSAYLLVHFDGVVAGFVVLVILGVVQLQVEHTGHHSAGACLRLRQAHDVSTSTLTHTRAQPSTPISPPRRSALAQVMRATERAAHTHAHSGHRLV